MKTENPLKLEDTVNETVITIHQFGNELKAVLENGDAVLPADEKICQARASAIYNQMCDVSNRL